MLVYNKNIFKGGRAMESRTESIYRELEEDIVNLRIRPGELLSENPLCERFQISRTPVRTVLQRLQGEGLVEITPHIGTCVTRIRYPIVSQIIYQRVATESAIIRDFVGLCGQQELVQLHHYLSLLEEKQAQRRSGAKPDPMSFYAIDKAMHEIWYRATQKLYLWEYINSAKADYLRFCMLDMEGGANYDGVVEEHAALVRAVEQGDLDAVEPVVRRHFEGGMRRLGTRVYTDLRDYFDPAGLEV